MKKIISLGIVAVMLLSLLSTSVVFAFGAKSPEKQEIIHVETVIKPKYEAAAAFNDGYAAVKIDGKYGMIDKSGKLVLEAKYDALGNASEGYVIAALNGEMYIVNLEDGSEIRPTYKTYDLMQGEVYDPTTDSYHWVEVERSFHCDGDIPVTAFVQEGVVNLNGWPVLTDGTVLVDTYEWVTNREMIGPCVGGLIPLRFTGYWISVEFIDKTGNTVKTVYQEDYSQTVNGWSDVTLCAFPSNDDRIVWMPATSFDETTYMYYGKYGVLDSNYRTIVPPTYENIRYALNGEFFVNGLLVVMLDGKYGAINRDGDVVIPCEYEYLEVFAEPYSFARKDGVGYVVDMTGKRCEIVGVNGAKVDIQACSVFNEKGIAVAYDAISEAAVCIKYDADLGSAYVVPTDEKLDITVFIPDFENGFNGDTEVRGIEDDLVPSEKNGKWGYVRMTLGDKSDFEKDLEEDDEDDKDEDDKEDEKSSLLENPIVPVAIAVSVVVLGGGGYALVYVLHHRVPRGKK